MNLLYCHVNNGSDVRVIKVMRTLKKHDKTVHFFGLSVGGFADEKEEFTILEAKYSKKRPSKLDLIRYIAHLYFFIIKKRPKKVVVVNEYLAVVLLPLFKLMNIKYTVDVYDSLYERFLNKGWKHYIAKLVCKISYSFSENIIVTDLNRKDRLFESFSKFNGKVNVVENFPMKMEIDEKLLSEKVKALKVSLEKSSKRSIFVAGSLSKGRGIISLLEACSSIDNVRIIAAGWVYDDTAELFVENDLVEYIGVITDQEYLYLASTVDFIYMYYEPCNQNNINASPNKVYDAILSKTKLLANSELTISQWIQDSSIGLIAKYGDKEQLRKNIESNNLEWSDNINSENYTWNSIENNIIDYYLRK